MSAYLIAFLIMFGASIVVVAAALTPLVLRGIALARRSRKLSEHPTLVAIREAQAVAEKFRGLQVPLQEIKERSVRIAQVSAELIATSALLRLQVDRISFATRLLLQTLVPTLRGSLAD